MRCVCPPRHERGAFDCPHRGYGPTEKRQLHRWRTTDGCSGESCMECFFDLGINGWPDLCQIAVLDSDGIPLDQRAWGDGDRAVALERILRRLRDIQDVRALRGEPPWRY